MTNKKAISILAIAVEMAKGRCFVTDEAISDAYAMAISALQAQDSPKPKAESVQNVQNEDLILRNAAIDAILGITAMRNTIPLDSAIFNIKKLPSAQPEPCEDAVSREAAIDVAENAFVRGLLASPDIRRLPSAQPEIIHCKDCKHFGVDRYKKLTWCSRINYGYGYQADDFCSKAERRTDDLQ